jgi:hypothetical protein
VFELQPFVHVVPMQNDPAGQLSFVGKHWTQELLVVSQRGVGAVQSPSFRHCTHEPAGLHTWPVGQGCVALQPCLHTFPWQMLPSGQSPSIKHATHACVVVSHFGVGAAQSAFD